MFRNSRTNGFGDTIAARIASPGSTQPTPNSSLATAALDSSCDIELLSGSGCNATLVHILNGWLSNAGLFMPVTAPPIATTEAVPAVASPIRLFRPGERSAVDAYGREMTYLRISLTDRCNFRCVYCMPAIGMKFQPRDEMLSDDELIEVIGAFAEIGFTKFRLTGGEPTVRPHLVDIVRAIKRFPNVEEVTMTTNALLLGRMAQDLASAGMDRINVSLDTLDPDRFKAITRGGRFDMVWDGILAAERAGMTPIKINTVVVRGQNEQDVAELARLTLDKPWQMRFLEIMPMEGVGMVYDEGLVTSEETQARLEHTFGPLEHV